METLVMKFGGEAVKDSDAFARIATLILEKQRLFSRVAVVVSAMKGMTDELIALAKRVNPSPPRREYDMLVSVGERISISLLAMALEAQGGEAVSFTGSQSGIMTDLEHTEAKIVDVQPKRLLEPLAKGKCVIVAGFQGVSRSGEITTLGRGGSDATAVALAIALDAEQVSFYKDVTHIFDADPKTHLVTKSYRSLSYIEALDIVSKTGGQVLQPRCIALAACNHIPLHLCSLYEKSEGTRINHHQPHPRPSKKIYETESNCLLSRTFSSSCLS